MDSSCPDDFRCPISLEIMTDPVILPSGHTFDRSSIQRWLDGGNLTCPVTNLPLPSPPPPLIPNHALRRLISNSNPAPKQPQKPPPCPNKFLSSLKYPSDSVALSSLLRSVQKSAEFRQKVADSSIPKALIRHVADPQLPELQKLAIYSLLYLSLDGDDVKVGLVAEGAVESLVTAVKSGGGAAAAAAAAATVITSLATVDVNKVTIGAHPSAIGSLATMLLEGSGKREKKEAATALYELCKFPENRRRLIRVAGSVRSLAELAGSGLDRAVEVLAQLGKIKEGRADMGRIQGFVRVLVGVLERGSARGVESAISVLNLVCSEDERLGLEAMNEGVLGVLERLSNEEGGKIGKNSAALLEKLKRGIVKWV